MLWVVLTDDSAKVAQSPQARQLPDAGNQMPDGVSAAGGESYSETNLDVNPYFDSPFKERSEGFEAD